MLENKLRGSVEEIMDRKLDLFEEAKKSRVLLNIILSVLLVLIMMFLGQTIGGVLTAVIISITGVNNEVLNLSLMTIFPIIICFLWVKVIEKRQISSLGLKKNKAVLKFLKGIIIGLIMFSLVIALMYISGSIKINQGLSVGVNFLPQILLMFIGWGIQGSSEEILTRGWLMNVVGAKYKPIIGFVLSSVLFGFMHLLNPGINIVSVLNIILVGFLLGLYVIYTNNLWGACGIHAAWNFAQGNIYGFNVSGLDIDSNSLLTFNTQGSDILTGGEFGPEASIFATVVQVIIILILIIKIKRKNNGVIFYTSRF